MVWKLQLLQNATADLLTRASSRSTLFLSGCLFLCPIQRAESALHNQGSTYFKDHFSFFILPCRSFFCPPGFVVCVLFNSTGLGFSTCCPPPCVKQPPEKLGRGAVTLLAFWQGYKQGLDKKGKLSDCWYCFYIGYVNIIIKCVWYCFYFISGC